MTKTLLTAALLSVLTIGAAGAVDQHSKGNYGQGDTNKAAVTIKPAPKNQVASADGKRLPLRDCKWYDGGTQQHGFPQYEIGNPQRPECPEGK